MASPPITTRPPAKVAIIIVNWRNAPDTIACLESLQQLTDPDVRIIITDNGSGDRSVEAMTAWAAERLAGSGRSYRVLREGDLGAAVPGDYLTIIASATNRGFAGGNNLALRLALADPATEQFWLLNNDTEVLPDSLQQLRDRMGEDPSIGLCGSTLIYHFDKQTVQLAAGYYDIRNGSGYQMAQGSTLATLPSRDQVEAEMSFPCGASMLASRAFLDQVGLMEESYFLYFEELDWVFRGKPRFRPAWAPESVVYHKEGGSIGTNAQGRSSDLALYYNLVNRLRFARKFAPAAVPMTTARVVALIGRFALRMDFKGVKIGLIALGDFCTGRHRTGAWLSTRRKSG